MRRLLLISIFLLTLFVIRTNHTRAFEEVLFEDNFTLGDSGKWHVARNTCRNDNWIFDSGKYGISINNPGGCVTETVPNDLYWNPEWNDYRFELDIEFVSGTDKNIAWRYTGPNDWVDIHFINDTITLQRLIEIHSENIKTFENGETYHFTIEAVGNNHKIWYHNINSPNNVSYIEATNPKNLFLTGKPALQASVGAEFISSVWFDNIVVTDLRPEPGLKVTHFSQLDPEWRDDEYDHSSLTNPEGLREIEDWGCALTSSAMILDYYGYKKTSTGETLTPETLNQYFINNNGYTRNGSVIWSAVGDFATDAQTHTYYQDLELPNLEFEYDEYSTTQLQADIQASQPAILKLVMDDKETEAWSDDNLHFVVANGYEDENIYIKDPARLLSTPITLNQSYPDIPVRQLGRFIPSNTDLSYIWIYQYNPLVDLLIEVDGQKMGIDSLGSQYNQISGGDFFWEGTIAAPPEFETRFGSLSSSARVYVIPKPVTNTYTLSFSSNTTTQVDTDIYIYDQESGNTTQTVVQPVVPETPTKVTIDFDKSAVENTQITKLSDLDSLESSITYAHSQTWITSDLSTRLLRLVSYTKRYESRPQIVQIYVNRIVYLLNRYRSHIDQSGYDLIMTEIENLPK